MTITIDGLTKTRMLEIEAASITGGVVDGTGHLILTRHDGSPIDAGNVVGPQGPPYVNGVDTVSNQNVGGSKTFTKEIKIAPGAGLIAERGVYVNLPTGSTAHLVDFEVNGVRKLQILGDGTVQSIGASSAFGGGALGADMAAVGVGHYDADNAIVYPYQPVRANASLLIQSKGTGSVVVRNSAPSNLLVILSTGSSYFSGNPGTTHASNQVLGQAQIIGARGFAVSADGMPFYGGVTSGISVSINRTDPAMVVINGSGDVVQFLSGGANPALVVKSNGRVEMGTGGGGVATNGVQITNSPNGGFASVQITSAWGPGQGGSPIRCNNAGGTIFEIDMFGRVCFPLASTQGPIWVGSASGGAFAVPTTAAGFLMIQVNGTTYKIAGYNV